jgi:hypothetical protein
MIEREDIGRVSRVSIVPVLHSSVRRRMVTAGIRMSRMKGERIKKFSRLAYPYSRILKLELRKRKRPFSNKNNKMAR